MRRWIAVWGLASCTGPEAQPPPDVDPTDEPSDVVPVPPPVDHDHDGWAVADDCDDDDATVFPGAPDRCGDFRVTDCTRTGDTGLVTVDGDASFTDLQLALDAAGPDSEVRVCDGEYGGPFVAGVPIRLVAQSGAAFTRLDGDRTGTTLSLVGGSTVEGFTIVGGLAERGGGILQTTPGTLAVTDCEIRGNEAHEGGGIALAEGSTATVAGTLVTRNTVAVVDGQLGVMGGGGGLAVPSGTVVDLTGTTITDNDADHGGGILVDGGVVIGGTVSGNEAHGNIGPDQTGGGGGVALLGTSELVGTEILENASFVWGGGFVVLHGSVATFTDVSVHHNTTENGAGGVVMYGSDLTLAGTTALVANTAGDNGGGLYVRHESVARGGRVAENTADWGGGVQLEYDGHLVDAIVEDNVALHANGGVEIYVVGSITGGAVRRNTAVEGCAGIDVMYADAALTGVSITDNVAVDEAGGLCQLGSTVVVDGGEVLRNGAPLAGGAHVAGTGSLTSLGVDWGIEGDDNSVFDVSALTEPYRFDGLASFRCTRDGCVTD